MVFYDKCSTFSQNISLFIMVNTHLVKYYTFIEYTVLFFVAIQNSVNHFIIEYKLYYFGAKSKYFRFN